MICSGPQMKLLKVFVCVCCAPVCGPPSCQQAPPPGWAHPQEQVLVIAEFSGKALYMDLFCSAVVIFSFISICLPNVWHPSSVSETAAALFWDGNNTEWMQGWNDGKRVVASQTVVVQEVGLVLFWLQRGNVALERFIVFVSCFGLFFLFFFYIPQRLWKLEMISGVSSFTLTEFLKEQSSKLKVKPFYKYNWTLVLIASCLPVIVWHIKELQLHLWPL